MRILRTLLAFLLAVIGVVSTVGSGGGGGGGGGGGSDIGYPYVGDPPIPPKVDITAANAQNVSATVVRESERIFDFVTTIGGQIFPSPPAAPDLLSGHSKFALFESAVTTGEPVTDACAVSGTVTVSGDPDNNPVTLSVYDVFNLVFDACDEGDGYSIDGNFSLKVRELEGDPRTDVFQLKYLLVDIDITLASGAESYTTSGEDIDLAWDSLSFPVIVLTPFPYFVQIMSQDGVFDWIANSVFPFTLTVNADTSPITTIRSPNADIRNVGGIYLYYRTIVPLQATYNQAPESGEILVTGEGTVRIVIESSASVRLEVDIDGDGTVDDYQYTTWTALRG